MRWLRCGVASALRGPLPRWVALAAITLVVAGCATPSADSRAGSGAIAQAGRGDVEDDGLPPQAAPRFGIRNLPDDPREPFSPNYGLASGARHGNPARLSRLEEDALIATAIAAHEMRRP